MDACSPCPCTTASCCAATGERNCYACALGGADGRTLFLCVTPADFNPDVRRANPLSAVLSTRVDVALA